MNFFGLTSVWTNFIFYKNYFTELKYKIFYSLFMIILTACCIFYNRIPILYFFSHHLLINITSSKFFFSHISQFFWTLWEISFIFACNFSVPFIFFNIFIFFLSGLTKSEAKRLWKWFFVFCIYLGLVFFLIYTYIIPSFLNFFLSFSEENSFFSLHLEVKFEEYFFMFIKIFLFLELLFLFPLFLSFLIISNCISFEVFLQSKNFIYIFFIILSLVISPPDFFIQSSFILMIIFLIEFFFFVFLFFKYWTRGLIT
jgi:sec-independent protein translocase protein TatC